MSLTIIRNLSVTDREVDTSLEDSVRTGVTIDTNPSRGSAVFTRRGGGGEGTSDSGEGSLLVNG